MNKTVLITGASRGIGRAAAQLFARSGCHVILNYNYSRDAALALSAQLNGQGYSVLPFKADVCARAEVDAMVKAGVARFGQIDVLVNNAGIAQQKLFTELTDDDWQRMLDVHVTGAFHCCQSVLGDMIRRRQGKIINVSSIWGITGGACEVHYSCAKAALIGLTRALAKELGPSNIQVNCVAPGAIQTDMTADLDAQAIARLEEETPLGRLGTAQDIANALFFLASAQADFITGQVLSPNGGLVI